MPPTTALRIGTPDRRLTPVSRREQSNTPTRHFSAERSKFCGKSVSANSTQVCSAAKDRSSTRNNAKTDGPLRSSALFGDRPAAATTMCHTRSIYTPPPTNPKQAEKFWNNMWESNARMTEMHEKICQSKGIVLRPKKASDSCISESTAERCGSSTKQRAGSSQPTLTRVRNTSSTACRRAPSSENARRTPSPLVRRRPETPDQKRVNGYAHTPATHAPAAAGAAASANRGAKARGVRNGPGEWPMTSGAAKTRQRPTISAAAGAAAATRVKTNGTSAVAESRIRRSNGPLHRTQTQRPHVGDTPVRASGGSMSGGASPKTISSRRMNWRTETAPYLEGSGGEQSRGCSPKKLQYEQCDSLRDVV
ncbi:hypothetical protein DQ04_02131110 [Trypanosoma grayi]|uniref:hypothetical protein n=1 Tax=Trypanosoma grayi TaxID=71804 RepID=UPI0004F46F56|nr:hypothetical protein DQ04_02131110 [Trypanosoma grayi]KEG11947.1 hypothetical protein DQ04_02131110 [Trypanosoma grayi]